MTAETPPEELARLQAELDARGGRGVDLAERIDELQTAGVEPAGPGRIWTLRLMAEDLGLEHNTLRVYHTRATRRRRRELPALPGDLPAPDVRLGRSIGWSDAVYQAWKQRRPGRGVGGGRPPKAQP